MVMKNGNVRFQLCDDNGIISEVTLPKSWSLRMAILNDFSAFLSTKLSIISVKEGSLVLVKSC